MKPKILCPAHERNEWCGASIFSDSAFLTRKTSNTPYNSVCVMEESSCSWHSEKLAKIPHTHGESLSAKILPRLWRESYRVISLVQAARLSGSPTKHPPPMHRCSLLMLKPSSAGA